MHVWAPSGTSSGRLVRQIVLRSKIMSGKLRGPPSTSIGPPVSAYLRPIHSGRRDDSGGPPMGSGPRSPEPAPTGAVTAFRVPRLVSLDDEPRPGSVPIHDGSTVGYRPRVSDRPGVTRVRGRGLAPDETAPSPPGEGAIDARGESVGHFDVLRERNREYRCNVRFRSGGALRGHDGDAHVGATAQSVGEPGRAIR